MGSLTEEQESILVGCLLGDGTMRKKKNALLEINHCLAQKSLVDWIFSYFKDLSGTAPKSRKGNGKRQAYRFVTLSLPSLTIWYDKFFPQRRKIIPDDLQISPLTLAIWFMDDGSRSGPSVYLNTQYFTKSEQVRLIDLLNEQLGIESTLNKDKQYFRLRVRASSMKKFEDLVKPFILDEFRYKLPSVITP